jgi:hypothetical protein
MEIEPHDGTFKFLESMITVKENHISCQFYLRNYDRKQRQIMGLFLNTQHLDSYTNAAVKRALVQGALYRILRFSGADASVVLPVVAHWTTELRAHGYPAAVMHQAILKITKSSITEFLRVQIDQMVTASKMMKTDLGKFPPTYYHLVSRIP